MASERPPLDGESAMTVARWSSLAIALTLLAPSAALAHGHHDRDWDDRDDDRAVVYANPGYGYAGYAARTHDMAFNTGYSDGMEKGREDAWNRNPFDFTHHLWYRGASRGYDGYGSHDEYREIYRDGFREGYEAGYGARPAYGPVYEPGPVYAPAPVYRPRAEIHIDWHR